MHHAPTGDSSHPNREFLAKLYNAFAHGDVGTVMASLTDDIEWRVHRPCPVAGIYRGKDVVLEWFPRMAALYDGTLRVEVTAIHADDHHGFVSVAERAGRPVEGLAYTGIHAWEFREVKGSRFESYYDDAPTNLPSAWWTRRRHEGDTSGSRCSPWRWSAS